MSKKLIRFTLLVSLALAMTSLTASNAAHARSRSANGNGKKEGKHQSYDGTVIKITAQQITLDVGTNKSKVVSLNITKDTTISGTVEHGARVTVTASGYNATTIQGEDAKKDAPPADDSKEAKKKD